MAHSVINLINRSRKLNLWGRTPPTPHIPTCLGYLTFGELHHSTVGYMMCEHKSMSNPEVIDDCIQLGYPKLWQKLERKPG